MSKKKDKNNQVRLSFISNNTISVTGSSMQLEFFDHSLNKNINILLELGMSQEGSKLDSYLTNSKLLEKIDTKSIDFVIIPHIHNDHSALLPFIVSKHDFNGQIVTTKENKAMLPIMLMDSAWIIENDIDWLKKNKKTKNRTYIPFYKMQDVENLKKYILDMPESKIINLTDNIQIRLLPNMHCYGSVSVELFFKDSSSRVHKLFYSSDIGNTQNEYFISKKQRPAKNSNVSIYESTYGERIKDMNYKKLRKEELELLEKTIKTTVSGGGDILIPCFAFQRTPTVAMYVKKIIENNHCLHGTKLIIDGRLSNDLLDVFEKICEGDDKKNIDELLNWDNLIRVRSFKETSSLINDKSPSRIIISSSGMMTAGHVKEWAKNILPRKRNSIIFIGYSVEGSLATKIKQHEDTRQKTVKIDKSIVIMNCKVVTLNSFSSHASRRDLINYIMQTNTSNHICLVHGSTNAKLELAEDICKRLEDECLSTKVIIPKKNQVIYF